MKCISLSHFGLKTFGKGSHGSGQIEESDGIVVEVLSATHRLYLRRHVQARKSLSAISRT